jgi:hypothetical protein
VQLEGGKAFSLSGEAPPETEVPAAGLLFRAKSKDLILLIIGPAQDLDPSDGGGCVNSIVPAALAASNP